MWLWVRAMKFGPLLLWIGSATLPSGSATRTQLVAPTFSGPGAVSRLCLQARLRDPALGGPSAATGLAHRCSSRKHATNPMQTSPAAPIRSALRVFSALSRHLSRLDKAEKTSRQLRERGVGGTTRHVSAGHRSASTGSFSGVEQRVDVPASSSSGWQSQRAVSDLTWGP